MEHLRKRRSRGRTVKQHRCLCQNLDFSTLRREQRSESDFLMHHTDGWMGGWAGGGMWLWTVIAIGIVVLLVVIINKRSKR